MTLKRFMGRDQRAVRISGSPQVRGVIEGTLCGIRWRRRVKGHGRAEAEKHECTGDDGSS